MADKASRALVLYGDGLAPQINTTHRHLHSLASRASCGFLALPRASSSELENERVVREVEELFDSRKVYIIDEAIKPEEEKSDLIKKRFMGMKVAIVTEEVGLNSFANRIGCDVMKNMKEYPTNLVTYELLKMLGFREGMIIEENPYDLVFVHVGASDPNAIEYINALIGDIMEIAKPGSGIGSRLHLSVVMSYGNISETDHSFPVLIESREAFDLPFPYPRQSYIMKAGNVRNDVRNDFPMLIAQWQDAVTRRDRTKTYTFDDFKEWGGIRTIPADRFVHEIAFKLWKSPKYGA